MGLTEPHPVPIPAPPAHPNLSLTQTPVGFCEAGLLSNPGSSSSRRATRATCCLCVSLPEIQETPGGLTSPRPRPTAAWGRGRRLWAQHWPGVSLPSFPTCSSRVGES